MKLQPTYLVALWFLVTLLGCKHATPNDALEETSLSAVTDFSYVLTVAPDRDDPERFVFLVCHNPRKSMGGEKLLTSMINQDTCTNAFNNSTGEEVSFSNHLLTIERSITFYEFEKSLSTVFKDQTDNQQKLLKEEKQGLANPDLNPSLQEQMKNGLVFGAIMVGIAFLPKAIKRPALGLLKTYKDKRIAIVLLKKLVGIDINKITALGAGGGVATMAGTAISSTYVFPDLQKKAEELKENFLATYIKPIREELERCNTHLKKAIVYSKKNAPDLEYHCEVFELSFPMESDLGLNGGLKMTDYVGILDTKGVYRASASVKNIVKSLGKHINESLKFEITTTYYCLPQEGSDEHGQANRECYSIQNDKPMKQKS